MCKDCEEARERFIVGQDYASVVEWAAHQPEMLRELADIMESMTEHGVEPNAQDQVEILDEMAQAVGTLGAGYIISAAGIQRTSAILRARLASQQ